MIEEFRKEICDKECPISRFGKDECKGSCLMFKLYFKQLSKSIRKVFNDVETDLDEHPKLRGKDKNYVFDILKKLKKRHLSTLPKGKAT